MKIIPKLQRGGPFSPIFAQYIPIAPQQQQQAAQTSKQSSASTSSTKSSSGGDSKEMLSILKGLDGLPNEIQAITKSITQLYDYTTAFSGDSDTGGLTSLYAQCEAEIKMANFNKKEYDKAYQLAVKNDGLNEIAIDAQGFLYAYDKDKKLKQVTVGQYLKNKDKYSPITNSNLLWLRAHDPQFINNNVVFSTVSNSIGMGEVVKQIKANLSTLGSSTEDMSGLVHRVGDKVISGLEALRKLAEQGGKAAVDGIYKVKSSNTNSEKQAKAAIEWLFESLTPNAQMLLMIKGGDSQNPTKGAYNLLSKRVMSMMSDKVSYSEDYQDDFNPDGSVRDTSKSSKSGGEDDLKQNVAMAFMNGGGYTEQVDIVPGSNIGGSVVAVTQGIPGTDNKPFQGQYLSELASSGIGPMMDTKNATMGGHKVVLQDQVQILYNKMHAVWWPVKDDGVTPDFSDANIEEIKAANKEIATKQIAPDSPEAIQIMKDHGIPNPRSLKRFFVFDAMTNNKALGVDRFDSTPLLETVSDSETKAYLEEYKSYFSKDKSKGKNMDFDEFSVWNINDWFGGYDDVYKGTVWVPMLDDYMNALAGTGETIKTDQFNDYERRQWEFDRDKQLQASYIDAKQYE